MKKEFVFAFYLCAVSCMAVTCKKQSISQPVIPVNDTPLVNLSNLDYLYTPVKFQSGTSAAGIFIYSEAPDYHRIGDADEGFTCVDDVARAAQVYLRSDKFYSDTSIQNKTFNLINFILEMQSANAYFFNFLFPDFSINMNGGTSINNANWWSWRALYALSEASPVIRKINVALADKIDAAISKLVAKIKTELVPLPQTNKIVNGIIVPQWLPAGSGTDQAAILILGLIPSAKNDAVLTSYIKKLADGIAIMQLGDATHFPYSCILSWENTWHAYGSDQAYALMKAGSFLNDDTYTKKGIAEVDNFYPWLLQNGMKSSFEVKNTGTETALISGKSYEQIAYGIRPMVSAAAEAYRITNDEKYADLAGHLAAWFLGANDAGKIMYSVTTGRCFDGINSSSSINMNSGAESTIEALMAMEIVESYPAIKAALNKYKK
jgi:hypothetical protein